MNLTRSPMRCLFRVAIAWIWRLKIGCKTEGTDQKALLAHTLTIDATIVYTGLGVQ